jgi:hypothetical protein
MVRLNSLWSEESKASEPETWVKATILKAMFRAPFSAYIIDDEEDEAIIQGLEEEDKVIDKVQVALMEGFEGSLQRKQMTVKMWDIKLPELEDHHRSREDVYEAPRNSRRRSRSRSRSRSNERKIEAT